MTTIQQCNCERGGDCTKTTVCALTNLQDEYNQWLDRIELQAICLEILAGEPTIRVKELNEHISEIRLILKERY